MKTPTYENRIFDIIAGIRNLQQDIYNTSCEIVSEDALRPDIRVDRVVKLNEAISSLGRLALRLDRI